MSEQSETMRGQIQPMQFPNNLRLAFGHSNLKGWIYLRQNQKKAASMSSCGWFPPVLPTLP